MTDHRLISIRIEPYVHENGVLVDLTLRTKDGSLGKVLTEEDLVVLRDAIDSYIQEHFPKGSS